jgi:hypothetical protein
MRTAKWLVFGVLALIIATPSFGKQADEAAELKVCNG